MSNVDRDACRSLKPGTGKEWTGHPAKDPRQLLKDGKSQETWFRSLQKKLALRALCCLFYKAQFLPPRTPSPATSQEPSRSQHLKLLGLCCGDGEVSSQRKPRLGRRLSWESRAAEAAVQVQELRDVRCGTRNGSVTGPEFRSQYPHREDRHLVASCHCSSRGGDLKPPPSDPDLPPMTSCMFTFMVHWDRSGALARVDCQLDAA